MFIANNDLEKRVLAGAIFSEATAAKIFSICNESDFTGDNQPVFGIMKSTFEKFKAVRPEYIINADQEYRDRILDIACTLVSDVWIDQDIAALKEITRLRNLDNAIMNNDEEMMLRLLSERVEYNGEASYTKEQLQEAALKYLNTTKNRAVSPGWVSLSHLYRVAPGQLSIVTGIPSSGKSAWLDALTVNMVQEHNWRFMMFSPENQPIEEHVRSLAEKYYGFSMTPGYGGPDLTQTELKIMIDKSVEWIAKNYIILDPNNIKRQLDIILAVAEDQIKKHGRINGFVIDPWNELDHSRPSYMSETEYIGLSLMKVKQFALRNRVHVWIVAHPMKLKKDEDGNYSVPTLYDISGSAKWRDKADCGLVVWRDFNTDEVVVYVQKIRFKNCGSLGYQRFEYNIANGRYKEVLP